MLTDRDDAPGNWLRRLDARVKLIGVLGTILIFAVTPTRHVRALAADAALLGILAGCARLSFRNFARSLLASGTFAGAALLGCLFGAPVLPTAATAARLSLCTVAFELFTSTTPFPQIAASLRFIRVPPSAVTVLLLAERYVHVLGEEAQRMLRALRARAPSPLGCAAPRIYAHIASALILRTVDRSERVALALVSRGFCGEFPSPPSEPAGALQWAGVAGWISTLAILMQKG